MNIEKEIFKRSHIDFQKLEEYGFEKINQTYYYEVSILDNRFHVEIEVDEQDLEETVRSGYTVVEWGGSEINE